MCSLNYGLISNAREAFASVKVIDKSDDRGIPIRFEIRDEDLGNPRAIWAEREGKPNLLLISARHESLRRYLGPRQNNDYPGQRSPLFRALIAEIIAENICKKALDLESKERPFDFPWADSGEPRLILDDVFVELHKRLRVFLPKAHRVMLEDQEVREIVAATSIH